MTERIIGAAIDVHRGLGPGLLESVYEKCLWLELVERGLFVERQKPVNITYQGRDMGRAFRIDLLVEDTVIVELKSVSALEPVHTAQLLTYLKLSGYKLGLLINFNVPFLRLGIRRLIVD